MTSEISRLEIAIPLKCAHWHFRRRIVGIAVPWRVIRTRYVAIAIESGERGAFLIERNTAEAGRGWGRRRLDAAIVAELKRLGLVPQDQRNSIGSRPEKELHPFFPDETSRVPADRPLYLVHSRELPICVRDALVSPGSRLMQRLSTSPNVLAIETRSLAPVRCDHTAAVGLRPTGRLVLEQLLSADHAMPSGEGAARSTALAWPGRGLRAPRSR